MKVKENWDRARKSFNYPGLKDPEVVKSLEGGACFNFSTQETLVSEPFVKRTCSGGRISEDTALEAIFSHEIGHYMHFPQTLWVFILSAKMINDFFNNNPDESKRQGKETCDFILQTYADMANDIHSALNESRTGPVLALREALQPLCDDPVNGSVRGVMLAFLKHQANRPYEISDELRPFLERMLEIDFRMPDVNRLSERDVNSLRVNLYLFGNIICDIIDQFGNNEKGGGQGGKSRPGGKPGSDKTSGSGKTPSDAPMRDVSIKELLENVTPDELKQALREIAGKVSKREYDKTVEWLKEEMGDGKDRIPQAPKKAMTVGTSAGELKINPEGIRYYKDLSGKYPLVISRRLLETKATVRTWDDVEKWRPGKDSSLIKPESSGGRMLPGVTKAIHIGETPIKSRDYKVPHVLIIIDSSGSMPDPMNYKSFSVLAGYCVARSYHTLGSCVGVINFSGVSFYLPYTRELDFALGAISAYQGGGTTADIDMIRTMLGDREAERYKSDPTRDLSRLPRSAIKKRLEVAVPDEIFEAQYLDVVMFTDGGIYNLGEVLALLDDRAELNRATIVLSHGYSQDLPELQGRKTNILQVESVEEIPNIVLKETQRGFNSLEWKK